MWTTGSVFLTAHSQFIHSCLHQFSWIKVAQEEEGGRVGYTSLNVSDVINTQLPHVGGWSHLINYVTFTEFCLISARLCWRTAAGSRGHRGSAGLSPLFSVTILSYWSCRTTTEAYLVSQWFIEALFKPFSKQPASDAHIKVCLSWNREDLRGGGGQRVCTVLSSNTCMLSVTRRVIQSEQRFHPDTWTASWSLPFIPPHLHPSAFCFPPLSPFFSLLNCKYQVPFILFCYYCYYIVVLVIFFSLSSRPAQQLPGCLSSVAVCKYDFISVPGSGGEKTEQNVSFLFSLPPFLSVLLSLVPHKCCHYCFIYCTVFSGHGWYSLSTSGW